MGRILVSLNLVYPVVKQSPECNRPPVIQRIKYGLGVEGNEPKKERAFQKNVLKCGP